MAKDREGQLITKVEQTQQDLSNMLRDYRGIQATRAETNAWLKGLDEKKSHLVSLQAGRTPRHLVKDVLVIS